ncbi:transposase [Corynebacterium diphtheriae]|nr:transposase [Corynebacterium diphtheriae] [Corynebacterium diphtheriae subsp. lausannense]
MERCGRRGNRHVRGANWWNEPRLHQSLGYHTPAEVETEFWEHHPSHDIIKHKANA